MPELVEKELNVVRGSVYAGCHPTTFHRALSNGEIPFRWEDGRRLVLVRDIDAWVAKRRRHPSGGPVSPEAAAS